MKKLLITGSSGFIGRNILPRLAGTGFEICLFDRRREGPAFKDAVYFKVDLTDRAGLEKVASESSAHFDACIHLAGQTNIARSLADPLEDLKANVYSVINLLSVFKFDRFIYVSTGSVYEGQLGMDDRAYPPSPTIPYVISKYTGELYTRSFHKTRNNPGECLILRLFNPYGPYEDSGRFIPRLVTQFAIKKDPVINIRGTGAALINPMYIDDTASAIIKALYCRPTDESIDICAGNPMTVLKLVQAVASIFNISPVINYSGPSYEEISFFGDPAFQEKALGFKPNIPLHEGMLLYYNFLKREGTCGGDK